MIVAIHQPNYFPWLGYFHKIKSVDRFVFLDNAQIPGKSFANRCFIKGKHDEKVMLTVPINKSKGVGSSYLESIPDYSTRWQQKHLNKIKDAYHHSPFFEKQMAEIEPLILARYEQLSEMNMAIIISIMRMLNITTPIAIASECEEARHLLKNERNLALCKWQCATMYLSGAGALKYNDEALYLSNNIQLQYQSFHYPQYTQSGKNFISGLSILDALFHVDTVSYLLD